MITGQRQNSAMRAAQGVRMGKRVGPPAFAAVILLEASGDTTHLFRPFARLTKDSTSATVKAPSHCGISHTTLERNLPCASRRRNEIV